MRITRLLLSNWKNFRAVDLALQRRVFIVGPNAAGKSNMLDSLRFLRDVANPEGGFQRAVRERGGISQLRSLHARRYPDIAVEVGIALNEDSWTYRLEFTQDNQRRPLVSVEQVVKNGQPILTRPDGADEKDSERLTQTYLEQVNANTKFREVSEFLSGIRYLHVVPQLIRESDRMVPKANDPYGSDFLEQIARTPKRVLQSRLKRINQALRVAVPQLTELKLIPDERGIPHLQGLYEHWRKGAGHQTEKNFSDGTLRLLGLLWAFLDGTSPLLLEEPELSLHAAVIRHIPGMMVSTTRRTGRQVIVTTHSADLLSDEGIAPEEVVLLQPTDDGTKAQAASSIRQVKTLLQSGMPMGEAVLPLIAPRETEQLSVFGE